MAKEDKKDSFSLKDELFNRKKVTYLAELFKAKDKTFNASGFTRDVLKTLKSLELKERIVHIACTLEGYLDDDYRVTVKQIVAALPPPLDPKKTDDDFGDFIFAPLGEFIVRNGLSKKHLKLSLRALKELTQRFSMEDAIRAFINEYPKETMLELKKWSTDKNYHVRRLVSEGTRPLLPWSGRLSIDVFEPLPFLDVLHADKTRYVTRSVANHLNDIAKTHPKIVIKALKDWKRSGEQDTKEFEWMSKHALRTLIKQGHPQALTFLGFRSNPKISVNEFKLVSPRIRPGTALEFSFELKALRSEALMVDYVIDFVKASGALSPKVYKIKQLKLEKGETSAVTKRHALRANATTYKLYPGTHYVTLQINGKQLKKLPFEILK